MRPYRTVDNKIDGVVITFVDMTERRGVEEALRANERQLRQLKRLIDLSRDPIFVWDFDGGIMDWNRGCEELYGYSRQEALGKPQEKLLATLVPGSSFAELKSKLQHAGTWNGELQQRAKDGSLLTVEARLDLETVEGRRLVLESGHDVTERNLMQERQQLLLAELTHRVKNTLAIVQSIARQMLRGTPSPQAFVERFEGRLSALASAHDLLVQSKWQGADFAALAREQLRAYAGDQSDRIRIEGPSLILPADLATPVGLVLHELASNAAKYGSLSRRGGVVSVTWKLSTRNNERDLSVVWQETGGPKVEPPKTRGLGSSLIENGIPGAKVRREFKREGVVCSVELPLSEGRYREEKS
jgi:two-component system, chemotaxis family, CheB/CheR fusion protein